MDNEPCSTAQALALLAELLIDAEITYEANKEHFPASRWENIGELWQVYGRELDKTQLADPKLVVG